MNSNWSIKEKREYEAWLKEKQAIINTNPFRRESPEKKEKEIERARGNFKLFAKRYFQHLMDCDFANFHIKDVKAVTSVNDILAVMEWPREHAKSIIWNIMVPMFLKANGRLTGMMLSSANFDKAKVLLGDIQAELMFNKQFIADYGEQYSLGNWKDGHFVTADGLGFWAFGRGQSPRGTRKSDKRPNYGVGDDLDDAVIVRNEDRVNDAVDWFLGDFYGAMPNKGSWLIALGNRIHNKGILAKLVGDVEPDDPKRKDIYHSKVFALENPRTHKKDLSEKGKPAWKRYTRNEILKKMNRQGWRIGLREFFHEHIVEGRVFKDEHLPWVTCLQLGQYEKLITYNDPSYKATMTSNTKAILLIGKTGRYFDIIKAFCRRCSTPEMVRGHYNIAEIVPDNLNIRHYMEANFIQDLMLENYWREGEARGEMLRIRGDYRKKPDKEVRIENLTPFSEQGFIRFNRAEKQNLDMQEVRNQFLGFPVLKDDDGPDAAEGGIWLLNKGNKKQKSTSSSIRFGKYRRQERN